MLNQFAARLRACESGVAFTEFAMALPVLLTLGLCGIETANLAMAHLRVSNIAMMTADNAARVRDSIDEADVIELFVGAKMTGESIRFAQNGRIVLSSVEANPDDGNNGHGNSGGCDPSNPGSGGSCVGNGYSQYIRWQRCDGAKNFSSRYGPQGTGQGNNDLLYIGTAANPISAQPTSAIMVVEVSYNYQPIIPNGFLNGRVIEYESAFNVRQRTNHAITNVNNVTRRLCTTYQA